VYFQIWKVRLCQIKNGNKIEKKKGGGWWSLLLMMFWGAMFGVQCVFQNMESEAVLHEK
jgi:hypothetical protein